MAITTECPRCGARFRFAETLAGWPARCQECRQRFAVAGERRPAPVAPPAPADPTAFTATPLRVPAGIPSAADVPAAILIAVPVAPAPEPRPVRPRPRLAPARKARSLAWAALLALLPALGGAVVAVVVFAVARPVTRAARPPRPARVVRNQPPVMAPAVAAPRATIQVVLGPDGAYRDQNTIAPDDPPDPRGNVASKEYQVRLEAGRRYVIDMTSGQLDSYLRLTDAGATFWQEDDDSGGNLNARLSFTPPAAGLYKLYASDLRRRFGAYTLTIRRDDGPVP